MQRKIEKEIEKEVEVAITATITTAIKRRGRTSRRRKARLILMG